MRGGRTCVSSVMMSVAVNAGKKDTDGRLIGIKVRVAEVRPSLRAGITDEDEGVSQAPQPELLSMSACHLFARILPFL